MGEHAQDTIQWSSSEKNSTDILPVTGTRHTMVGQKGRVVTGYLTHARRRFEEALTALKKDFTRKQIRETTAYEAMSQIGMLYKIEEMTNGRTPEERYEER